MSLSQSPKRILESIVIASDNDPARPEFPPDNPKFPATPTYQIKVPGFENVWLKDESYNPTGTHKDRMAWEIVVSYKNILAARENENSPLLEMSIISSGSAAVAIQTLLRKYGLPNLRVLVDTNLRQEIIEVLDSLGCQIFRTDLTYKAYTPSEILKLTNNSEGLEITSNQAFDPDTRFYDWLAYEIINNSPKYCFIPFGTGKLYENIMNVNKREMSGTSHDPRFFGDPEILRQCNFIGATTADPHSKAEKLYSPHLPFVTFDEQWIRLYRASGFCGPRSDVHILEEKYLDKALEIAADQEITCEPSGIAGLAMMLQMKESLPRDKKMLIVNTGKTKYHPAE